MVKGLYYDPNNFPRGKMGDRMVDTIYDKSKYSFRRIETERSKVIKCLIYLYMYTVMALSTIAILTNNDMLVKGLWTFNLATICLLHQGFISRYQDYQAEYRVWAFRKDTNDK